MYNEFLFFYKKEPYKQFVWRYMGQISPQIREKSSLGHFCHLFLYTQVSDLDFKPFEHTL